MRASTAFNRILGLDGVRVTDVVLHGPDVLISVALSARRARCACGYASRASYDARQRRWRAPDVAGRRCFLVARLRRIDCPTCGVRTEVVPFARPGARHTTAFEAAVVWSVIHMDRTAASVLWRVAWETVDGILARAVGRLAPPRQLRRIGVDERSWRRHRAITVVVDHDSGRVIWVGEGARAGTFGGFLASLDPEVRSGIEVVSMDMGHAYRSAVAAGLPGARICFDPFHVMVLAGRALDSLRRRSQAGLGLDAKGRRRLRLLLFGSQGSLNATEVEMLGALRAARHVLARAWTLKEELADLYRLVAPEAARDYLTAWCARASRSRIPAMVNLARSIRAHLDGIVAAVEEGLSNARLEGFNSKIALINHRGYGHHSLESLRAAIYLCCGGLSQPSSPWVQTSPA